MVILPYRYRIGVDIWHSDVLESDIDNAMKRSSRVLEIFRELPDGARQWSAGFELALEQPAENYTSRMGRSLTVIAGGYKISYLYL